MICQALAFRGKEPVLDSIRGESGRQCDTGLMPAYDASDDLDLEAAVTSAPTSDEPQDEPLVDVADGGMEPVLPEVIRQRVISLAAGAMTGLPLDELPMPLRRGAKFAPNRRARLGGPVIAMQLTGDALLRQRPATPVVTDAGD